MRIRRHLLLACLMATLVVSAGCNWQGTSRSEFEGLVPGPTPNRVLSVQLRTTVNNIPADGRELRLWMPLPSEDAHQRISDTEIKTALRPMVRYEPVHGSAMVFVSGDEPLPTSLSASVSWRMEMHRDNALARSPSAAMSPEQAEALRKYLSLTGTEEELKRKLAMLGEPVAEDRPGNATDVAERERLGGLLAGAAESHAGLAEAAGGLADDQAPPADRARRVYDHLLEKLRLADNPQEVERTLFEAYQSGQVGPGEYVGVMVFMLRALGIPARAEYGFLVPEESDGALIKVTGPHRWVAVFLAQGWVPLDPVAAERSPELVDYYFGTDCAGRVRLGWGSDITLSPQQLGGELPIFFEPRAEVDDRSLPVDFEIDVHDLVTAGDKGKRR